MESQLDVFKEFLMLQSEELLNQVVGLVEFELHFFSEGHHPETDSDEDNQHPQYLEGALTHVRVNHHGLKQRLQEHDAYDHWHQDVHKHDDPLGSVLVNG